MSPGIEMTFGMMAAAFWSLLGILFVIGVVTGVAFFVTQKVHEINAWRHGMKLFISGSSNIRVLSPEVMHIIDGFIARGAEILVGDCSGVDSAVQRYLAKVGYKNVTIYTSNATPRNDYVPGCCIISCNGEAIGLHGEAYYAVKDAAMTRDCDCALAVWDGVSRGTKMNISRVKGMGKPCRVVTVSPEVRSCMNLLARARTAQVQGAPA